MANTVQVLLEKTRKRVAELCRDSSQIQFDENVASQFEDKFKKLYDEFLQKHMSKKVKCLDRHKVAAIFIKVAIDEGLIKSYRAEQHKFFSVAAEMIVTEIALSWMMSELNIILTQKSLRYLDRYSMPKAFACPTPYFDIFARNLHIAHEDYVVNPMDIAEKFFLIEYITLLENNIPMDKLHEW